MGAAGHRGNEVTSEEIRSVREGVVSGDEEKMRAERAAAGTSGVKRVTNWLLLPESQYMAIRTQVF